MKLFFKSFILCLCTFVTASNFCYAVDPPASADFSKGDKQIKADSAIQVGDTIRVDDVKYFDPTYAAKIDTPYAVRNIISFKINEFSNLYLRDSFTVNVGLRIIYPSVTNPGINDSVDRVFSIHYDTAKTYNSISSFVFYGAHRVTVKVLTVNKTVSWNPLPALRIENEIDAAVAYKFSCTADTIGSFSFINPPAANSNADELEVSWRNVTGADEYDLEWTYIDSTAIPVYTSGGTLNPSLIFRNNTSRVSVSALSYSIPLIYDNSGILCFRIRPVQQKKVGLRIEAAWSSNYLPAGLGTFSFRGHQRDLNWQSSVTYAEEGKRKVVVQYFDGSLRSRQTVTKDNTTKTTVVAESFYDYQGRPVVQVLPAPTLNSIIQYTRKFNTGLNGGEYDKSNYDTLADPSYYCGSGAQRMGRDSGAARYYSFNNPEKDIANNKFIPEAEGFAFTEVEYTQDNTGRISRQGGVGENYQLGGGHETKYYYGGSPDQAELDALFGTDVGDNSHYLKNMVRDANGQLSVSYVDMHGRTVATALAGDSTAGMRKLSSNQSNNLTENLVNPTAVVVRDLAMETKKSLLVSSPGPFQFNYTLNPQTLKKEGCNMDSICYDCLYDLEIKITDDCNNQKMGRAGKAFDTVLHNFSIGSVDTTCNAPLGFNVNFNLYLDIGNYEITKTLSISKYGKDYYRDSIFLRRNTCKTLQQFIDQQSQVFRNSSECKPTCESCTAALGSWETFKSNYYAQSGISNADTAQFGSLIVTAYQKAVDNCKALCDNTSEDDALRKAMLLDVTAPSGQYANPDLSTDLYSIFYTPNEDTPPLYKTAGIVYYDESGNVDKVFDDKAGVYVSPDQLDAAQFSSKFKESWAASLIEHHPEYCKLLKFEQHKASNLWDRKFEKMDTYQGALAAGYLNPTGNTTSAPWNRYTSVTANIDPLSAESSALKTELEDSLKNYVNKSGGLHMSLWGLACAMVKCNTTDQACFNFYTTEANAFTTDMCEGDLDMAWRNFRELYLNIKRNVVNRLIKNAADPAGCFAYNKIASSTLLSTGHFLNFNDAREVLDQSGYGYLSSTDVNQVKQNAQNEMTSYYNSACNAYVKMWVQQLAPCKYSSNDLNNIIIPKLLQVCKEASDPQHPNGASSVNPSDGKTHQYQSFEDVITEYNSAHGISNSYDCNAELITAPKPYNQQQVYSNKPIWTKPDNCECELINSLHSDYISNPAGATSFSGYLQATRHTSMAEADLNKLMSLCNNTGTCNYLPQPISLPPALQCNTGDICVSCEQVSSMYNLYTGKYPGAIPTFTEEDTIQERKNTLFENFMNNRLGFSKKSGDYLKFMQDCKAGKNPCDTLQAIMADFISSYYADRTHTAKPDFNGCDTSLWVCNRGNSVLAEVKLSDVIRNGVFSNALADTGNPAHNANIELKDTLCFGNGYTMEARFRNPKTGYYQGWSSPYSFSFSFGWSGFTNAVNFNMVQNENDHALYISQMPGLPADSMVRMALPSGFEDFATVKVKITAGKFYVYFNGSYVGSTVHPPVGFLYDTYFTPYSNSFELDWMKFYNSKGDLILNEGFNDCGNMSFFKDNQCKPDCSTAFTSYFNQRKGTSYGFYEIDSVYQHNCGYAVNICNDESTGLDTSGTNVGFDDIQLQNHEDAPDPLAHKFYDTEDCPSANEFSFQQRNSLETSSDPSHCSIIDFDKYLVHSGGPVSKKVIVKVISTTTRQHNPINGQDPDSPVTEAPVTTTYTFNPGVSEVLMGRFTEAVRTSSADLITACEEYHINFQISTEAPVCTADTTTGGGDTTTNNICTNACLQSDFAMVSSGTCTGGIKYKVQLKTGAAFCNTQTVSVPVYLANNATNTFTFYDSVQVNPSIGFAEICIPSTYTYDCVAALAKTCAATSACDSLKNIIASFKPYYVALPAPRPDCQTKFAQYYDSIKGTSYTFDQLQQLSLNKCGVLLPVCREYSASSLMLCGKAEAVARVVVDSVDNCSDSTFFAISTGTELYNGYVDSLKNNFDSSYHAKCLQAYKYESFTVTHAVSEYHYTLYYYDQAGNLVKTVPPAGVHEDRSTTFLSQVKAARAAGTVKTPVHTLITNYRYNTLNQVVAQKTPDAGTSKFWYDRLGRLAISQNAKQIVTGKYSYTQYDLLGRIRQVGEISSSTAMVNSISRDVSNLNSWFTGAANTRTQITGTTYDLAYGPSLDGILTQRNLRNRVSWTALYNTAADLNRTDKAGQATATYYTYDIHGNVDTLLQDYTIGAMADNNNRFKKMVYQYDLISGKVNQVAYQPGNIDAFYHRYSYDAENRITLVETSRDNIIWERDARYEYYKHGPLSRTVLGEQMVQGLDYVYTLQGWLKAINPGSPLLGGANGNGEGCANGTAVDDLLVTARTGNNPVEYTARNTITFQEGFANGVDDYFDGRIDDTRGACLAVPGGSYNTTDGTSLSLVAKDAYNLVLNYNQEDYNGIASPSPSVSISSQLQDDYRPLYNGNISSMAVNIDKLNSPLVYAYQYDQLNRLVKMDAYTSISENWSSLTPTNDYKEQISYDPNGKIVDFARWGKNRQLDDAHYNYYLNTNQLKYVDDGLGKVADDVGTQGTSNYGWNAIGEMTHDQDRGLEDATWTVYGKIQSQKLINDGPIINYTYDASGNRINKTVSGANGYTEWYVRDASGNVLSVYRKDAGLHAGDLTQTEINLYGNSRLGTYKPDLNLAGTPDNTVTLADGSIANIYNFSRDNKFFELSDHRSNNLATVSDKKQQHTADNATVDYYLPDVITAEDYSSFGALLDGRQIGNTPRFTYNGKQLDKELGWQEYGMREYLGGRVPVFASVDPLTPKYPELTPYQYASNRPIDGVDRDGLEYMKSFSKFEYDGSWYDHISAIDNGVIDVLNMVPSLWNSGVATIKSIKRGSYGEDLKRDAIQTASGVKQAAVKVWNEPLKTLTSPETLEFLTSIYISGKVPLPSGGKGSLVASTKSVLSFSAELPPGTQLAGFSFKAESSFSKFAFQYGKCVEFASAFKNQVARTIEAAGGQAQIFEINIGKNGLIGTAQRRLADNGLHQFVEVTLGKEVKIFDNFHPEGILKSDYIKNIEGYTNGKIINGAELVKNAKKVN